MSESWIEIRQTCVIRRPVHVVRAHFLDIDHHRDHGVHRRVRYEVLGREGQGLRARTTLSVLGQQLVDEVIYSVDAQGRVVQSFVAGKNTGGSLVLAFDARPDGATGVEAVATIPVRGFDRLLKPVIRWAFDRLLAEAVGEDIADLEGGYEPSADLWAAA